VTSLSSENRRYLPYYPAQGKNRVVILTASLTEQIRRIFQMKALGAMIVPATNNNCSALIDFKSTTSKSCRN